MSKVAIIGMLAGGALIFIVILGLIVISISPTQTPQTGVNQSPDVQPGSDELNGGQFQGLGEEGGEPFSGGGFGEAGPGGEFGSEPAFYGGSDLSGEEGADNEYEQLPAGELKDDYVAVPNDADNNGFIDFRQKPSGFQY